ncbi:hypothetical protein [Paenibacillus sp. FSL K6-2862]|uniref:hypothetical protein n=1 Tax=Paenibacillus sp. FSL K6-2862 TaxID=2921484 RepID=UPI0030FCEBEB
MDSIIITPNVGIGPFRLGMCKEEVEQIFRNLDHWRANDGIPGNPSYIEMLFIREHLEYDANERVRFIQLINPHYSGHFCIPCLFQGVDVFKTKAEDLIHTFKKSIQWSEMLIRGRVFPLPFKNLSCVSGEKAL